MKTTLKAKLPKSIRSITIIKRSDSPTHAGESERITVEPKRKRKKQTKGLVRIMERLARRGAKANLKSAETYLERHKRSNRKRRDGWLRDQFENTNRANRKAYKAFKLSKLFR